MKAPKIRGYQTGGGVNDKDKKPLTAAEKKFIAEQTSKKLKPYGSSPTDFYDDTRFKITEETDPSTGDIISTILDLRTGKPYDGVGRLRPEDITSYVPTKTPMKIGDGVAKPTVDPNYKPMVFGAGQNYNPNTGTYTDPLTGKPITPIVEQYNKGGKIMKAPKGIKGYYTGGGVTPEEAKNGIYVRNGIKYDQTGAPVIGNPDMSTGYNSQTALSTNTLPLTTGNEFQTSGDAPLTTLDEKGQEKKQPSQNEMKARNAANTAGQALGAYGSGYYATKENTSVGDNARSAGLAAVGKSGAIGGAVAGLAAIGDQVGKPIRERSEKVDTSGELIDEGAAKRNAMIGVTLSPSKRLTYKGGLTDVSGQAYLRSIEQPYKEQIAREKAAATLDQIELAKQKRDAGETSANTPNLYRPHEFAKGGKIVGAGSGTSDSINAKVKEGSFIVPAENSHIAEMLRKVVLKKAPKIKADLKQSGGENVRLSNSEHLFTPEETAKIEALGIDLDKLAPDAENGNYFAYGGKIPKQILQQNAERYKANNQSKKGTAEYEAKIKEALDETNYSYNDKTESYEFDADAGHARRMANINKRTEGYKKALSDLDKSKTSVKSADALNKLTQSSADKLGNKTPKAPSVKKVNKNTTDPNLTYISPQDLATIELIKAEANKTITPTTTPVGTNTTGTPSAGTEDAVENAKGKAWKAWSPQFTNLAGSAVEIGASLAQIKLGRDALAKAGARPVGEIDPTFQSNVDRAQAQSKYGFSAEENFLLNQENQNATNAARFAGRNFSGGSGGNAFNMERSAINEGWGRGLKAKIANQNLMLDKQQVANQMSLQKAQMSRQLFDDKLNAWNINQQAGGNLLGAGIRNVIGAGRYASALASINAQNQLGQ